MKKNESVEELKDIKEMIEKLDKIADKINEGVKLDNDDEKDIIGWFLNEMENADKEDCSIIIEHKDGLTKLEINGERATLLLTLVNAIKHIKEQMEIDDWEWHLFETISKPHKEEK